MADDKEQGKVPDPKTTAIDIPDLKKKKKERKKGGAAWGSGARGADVFEGATGGTRAAASAAASAAEGAAGAGIEAGVEAGALDFGESFLGRLLSRLLSPIARLVSQMASTMLGKVALAAMAAVVAAAVIAIAAKLLGGGAVAKSGAGPDLGGIASNIRIHAPGDQGLNYAASANHGDVNFGDSNKAGEAPKSGKAPEAGKSDATDKDAKPVGQADTNPESQAAGTSARSGMSNHLSTALGGALSGGQMQPFKSDFNFGKGVQSKLGAGMKGNLSGRGMSGKLAKSGIRGSNRANLGRRGMVASRALGQLRGQQRLIGPATSGGPMEGNSSAATQMFEGSSPTGAPPSSPTDTGGSGSGSGGSGSGSGGSGSGTVTPPGGNGSPCTNDQLDQNGIPYNGTCVVCQPPQVFMNGTCQTVGTPEAAPWAGMLGQAMQMVDMAKTLLIVASAMVTAMIAIALIWYSTCCAYIGAIFWAIAILLAVLFAAIVYMIGSQIKNLADQIGGMGGSAKDYQQHLSNIGDDLETGAFLAIFGGIGGFFCASSVSDEEQALESMANQQLTAPQSTSTGAENLDQGNNTGSAGNLQGQ